MSKIASLLGFQIKVLSSYFKKPKWDTRTRLEFFSYLFYYFLNICYYSFLVMFESILLLRYKKLKKVDSYLEWYYSKENQFWVALREGFKIEKQTKENVKNFTYGETSYFAIKESLEFIKLTKDDVFYDLGCGSGKTVFFANLVFGAKAVGIELISDFIKIANKIILELKLEKISFLQKDLFTQDLKDGTVFYVTPTCFDDINMEKLMKKFETLPIDSRVIVLTKDLKMPNLQQIGKKKLFYSWGLTDTFYYKVI